MILVTVAVNNEASSKLIRRLGIHRLEYVHRGIFGDRKNALHVKNIKLLTYLGVY